jgi:hydrogenase maturation protease
VKILVAGVGNVFLGDDGFGVAVAQRLAGSRLPAGVRVVDFGIRGVDLAYALLEAWDLVILVDAVHRGGSPGTLYLLEPREGASAVLSAHNFDPASVLASLRALGGTPPPLRVVGCEAGAIHDDHEELLELSPPVAAAVGPAIEMIHRLVAHA